MKLISMRQLKFKVDASNWKSFTKKEWERGIRPEKVFYYSANSTGISGLVFFANDGNTYYIIGRDAMDALFFRLLGC